MRTAVVLITLSALAAIGGTARADADAVPLIEPAEIAAAVDAAVAAIDSKAPIGSAKLVAWIDKAELATDAKAVRAALTANRWVVVDELVDHGNAVLTLEATTGARVTIALSDQRGSLSITPHPATTKAPGRCVPIPRATHEVDVNTHAITQDGESHSGQIHWKLDTVRTADVDGDGIVDAFVPIANDKDACPESVSWRVYAMRGACGHELGVVGPGWLAPASAAAPLDATGFRPLSFSSETTAHGNARIPVMTTTVTSFAIKNGRYVKTASKSSRGVCHHCATWWCHAP